MSSTSGHASASRRHWVWRSRHASFIIEKRAVAVTIAFATVTVAAAILAVTLGRVHIPYSEVIATLLGHGESGMRQQVIVNLRLPRVAVAIFAGASLGVSGAIFQSVSRNALGSPDIIGFTTGAATGALLQIVIFGGGPLAVAFSAMLGGLLTATMVYLLSFRHGATSGYRLVLTGIGAGATLNALNGLMLVKGDLDNAIAANLWLSGSLDARNWDHAVPLMGAACLLIPLAGLAARRLTMIEMGDDLARQLGINFERIRFCMIACAVLLAAIATAAAGPIAFLALAAPQLASRLTASRGVPMFSAATIGAFLLVMSDLATQFVATDLVLPIGRTTGLFGGLYLMWLLTRSKRS